HASHDQVADEVVERVHARVLDGMGIVVLHSGHYSKIFKRLMGTSCSLRWRSDEGGEREVIWTVNPATRSRPASRSRSSSRTTRCTASTSTSRLPTSSSSSALMKAAKFFAVGVAFTAAPAA